MLHAKGVYVPVVALLPLARRRFLIEDDHGAHARLVFPVNFVLRPCICMCELDALKDVAELIILAVPFEALATLTMLPSCQADNHAARSSCNAMSTSCQTNSTDQSCWQQVGLTPAQYPSKDHSSHTYKAADDAHSHQALLDDLVLYCLQDGTTRYWCVLPCVA